MVRSESSRGLTFRNRIWEAQVTRENVVHFVHAKMRKVFVRLIHLHVGSNRIETKIRLVMDALGRDQNFQGLVFKHNGKAGGVHIHMHPRVGRRKAVLNLILAQLYN